MPDTSTPDPPRQQLPEVVLTDPEAARELMNVMFLGHFREPASPSDVARQLDMPANLAHHHARKCERLGLLFRAGRRGGKVLYQLTALKFRGPRAVSEAAGQREAVFDRSVRRLAEAFLVANERSQALQDPREGWSVCSFGTVDAPIHPHAPIVETVEARPPLFVQRTFQLTPDAYRRVMSGLNELIQKEMSGREEPGAAVCTIAALGFEGVSHESLGDDSLSYSSNFTPWRKEEP